MPGPRASVSAPGALRPGRARAASASERSPRVQVSEMQRARLMGAAAAVVEELGYTRTTVAHITTRARVSRRTFYDLFKNREDCLLAVLRDTVEQLAAELAAAGPEQLAWRERVREGLWRILCFLDREPALARLLVVQSARGNQRVLEYREEILAQLGRIVDEGRLQSPRAAECPALAAEGVVGAALSIVYSRLLRGRREPLADLLGELMGMIVLPYLGARAARAERKRPAPAPVAPRSARRHEHADAAPRLGGNPLEGIPMRLTYRTARVLEDVAQHPGVNNRTVAQHVGITDQGQVSKLLARLERLGLLQNTGQGHLKGEPNAWQLTPTGREVAHSIQSNSRYPQPTPGDI